ncbi:uncharacterized protein LOC142640303 [Castanea sativa]|uniref:uncharacterized protein LOC142640303 n=1 Tax=Castanea sativa TaxID=21020 RepID=UPI003F64F8E5
MGGDASRRNHSLYFCYHQDKGHTMEDYRTLRDHLNQLVKAGKLNQFLHQPVGQFGHSGAELHRDNVPRPALGTINDREGTCQPHDDTLVVTIKIDGYDVKRVLVDQGSGVEIMYPDLYNKLNLRSEDLERPWLHVMGAVSSTLHLKVKYPTQGKVGELLGSQLNVNPEAVPCKQPPRRLSRDHAEVVRVEVNKLKQAEAIKEIFYLE